MELTTEQLPDGIQKIALVGRLDSAGAQEIGLRFTSLTTTGSARIVVDLSAVSYLASVGIRTLVTGGQALARHGGRMAIANPQPPIERVLKLARVDSFIPIYADLGKACADLSQSA
jgi:anti-anti-sigma factor